MLSDSEFKQIAAAARQLSQSLPIAELQALAKVVEAAPRVNLPPGAVAAFTSAAAAIRGLEESSLDLSALSPADRAAWRAAAEAFRQCREHLEDQARITPDSPRRAGAPEGSQQALLAQRDELREALREVEIAVLQCLEKGDGDEHDRD
jgi:hypothetical protein